MRLFVLALKVNAAARLKSALLTLLIAVAALTFLGVQELARASSSNLDDAMASDLGTTGSYAISLDPGLGLGRPELIRLVQRATASMGVRRTVVAVELPALHPECPPYRALGVLSVAVRFEADGRPAPFLPTAELPVDSDLCLAGLQVPHDAIREPTPEEKKLFGSAMILDADYESAVRLSSTEPVRVHVGLITGRVEDATATLRAALRGALSDAAAKAGIPLDAAVVVTRSDDGLQVRSASDGIKLVYSLIGWGVLLIGGLGLLASELIVLRDRNWFFGLARAVGATKRDIAALIVLDIVLAIAGGLALALLVAALAAPAISEFGRAAFRANLTLIRPDALATLLGGALSMLVAGAAYPAWRATRLDPLEVLERR